MRGTVYKSLNRFVYPGYGESKKIQASLSEEHPSFIKVMQRSHVSSPFYMMPSSQFCQMHLPKTDEILVFEGESGKSYKVKLLGLKRAFSGGWRGFAIAEKLVENGVLVFHLVGQSKFKVYIVRASVFAPADNAPRVVKTDACATGTEVGKKRTFESEKKRLKFVPGEIPTDDGEASDSSLNNKSVCLEKAKSFNMEGSNPKNSEKSREYLYKNPNHLKTSSPEAIAREIQATLSPEHRSFIKPILMSHFSNPFRMCPPFQFARKNLPISEEIFVFEVENGRSYNVKFLCTKLAFTEGWKELCEAEKLVENDILVLHLVSPCNFKVYIVRANGLAPVDEAPRVIQIDDCETEKTVVTEKAGKREQKHPKFVPADLIKENVKVRNSPIEKSLISDINNSLEILEGFQPSQAIPEFKDFKIVVNGTTIEFPETVRRGYYKLCCSRKSYLHRHLIEDIDHALATSIISKTVRICNAIKNSKISTPQEDIASWRKMLAGFEAFGMDVEFIKEKLDQLSGLTIDVDIYKEAENKRDRVEEKINKLQNVKRRLDGEIEGMKEMYEELATAPW